MKTLLSLAAVAVLGLSTPAMAQEVRIPVGDLDLSTSSGAARFDQRVDDAADRLCRDARRPGSRIQDRAWCREAVRAEAERQLPARTQDAYVRARATIQG